MLCGVCVCTVRSQTEPQFTQYMYNIYLVNPAYAGSNEAAEFYLLHRSQYVGLTGRAIATQAFHFNVPVFAISSGVGLTVMNDLIGQQRATYFNLLYTYRKKFSWGNVAAGIQGGLIQTSLDGSQLRAPDGNYQNGVNHNDNFLPVLLQQGLGPDMGAGVYINSKTFFAGAAVHHIFYAQAAVNTPAGSVKLRFNRTAFFTGGYHINIHRNLTLSPTALVKTNFAQVQTDVNVNFIVVRTITGGISFRGYNRKSVDALAINLGVLYKGFRAVYSYDVNLSYLRSFHTGSHEVSLCYAHPMKRKEKRGYFFHHPRFNL